MDRRTFYTRRAQQPWGVLCGSSGAASLSPIFMEIAAFYWNTPELRFAYGLFEGKLRQKSLTLTSSAPEAISQVANAAKTPVGIDFIGSAMLRSRAMTGSAT